MKIEFFREALCEIQDENKLFEKNPQLEKNDSKKILGLFNFYYLCIFEIIIIKSITKTNWLLELLKPNLKFFNINVDIGVAQKDAIQVDIESTLNKLHQYWVDFQKNFVEIEREVQHFKADFVLFDVSVVGAQLGQRFKIPSIVISNFDWVFIYENLISIDKSKIEKKKKNEMKLY